MERIYESAAETAKKVRAELKRNFPNTKFSVRSKAYSGGSSVNVEWTDLPVAEDVNYILARFKSGHFDGMQDLYIDGAYEYEGKLYVGAKYIHGSRNLSPEYRTMLEQKAAEMFADYERNSYRYHDWIMKAEKEIFEEVRRKRDEEIAESARVFKLMEDAIESERQSMSDEEREQLHNGCVELDETLTDWVNEEPKSVTKLFPILNDSPYAPGYNGDTSTPESVTIDSKVYVKVSRADGWSDTFLLDRSYFADGDSAVTEIHRRYPYLDTFIYQVGNNPPIEVVDEMPMVGEVTTTPDGHIVASSIRFDWSECNLIADNTTVATFAEADKVIRDAAACVPGHCCKVGFTITYSDGEEYEGRIDVTREHADQLAPLTQHMRDFVEFSANIRKPANRTDEEWAQWMNGWGGKHVDTWRTFYDAYQIGDIPVRGPESIVTRSNTPQVAQVINLTERRADAIFDRMTPVDRLMLHTLTTLVDEDTISTALAQGVSVAKLFEAAAFAADFAKMRM